MMKSSTFFPTTEWEMCSPEEASDRRRFKEISALESTNLSKNLHPKDRIPDPMRCVKKYRRSAAGGGAGGGDNHQSIDGCSRSIHDLECTVNYLLGIVFSTQSSAMSSSSTTSSTTSSGNDDEQRVSLLQAVLFVDDRIRAVQVDLTTLLGQSTTDLCMLLHQIRNIQAKILRYHLLSQHLLSSLSSKEYEWKFGHKALTTAISSYFATWNLEFTKDELLGNDYMDGDITQLDEIMSYVTLLHVASLLNSREASIQPYYASSSQQQKWIGLSCDDGRGMSALLGLYRKYCHIQFNHSDQSFPKYHWALKIACDIENGNYLSVIRSLTTSKSTSQTKELMFMDIDRWGILSRSCMAQVMPILRIGLVRLYNKSFMKEEKVKDHDLANLLHLPNPEAATAFCKNIGLPIISNDGNRIVMKAAPICVQSENCSNSKDKIRRLINPGRDEDKFVFSSHYCDWLEKESELKKEVKDEFEGMSSLQRAMAKAKISQEEKNASRDEVNKIEIDDEWILRNCDCLKVRVDEDTIKILPSHVIRKLIFL